MTRLSGLTFLILIGVLVMPLTAQGATQDPKHFLVDVVTINGEEFIVKDQGGVEGKIHVGSDTEKYGQIQPGDRIEAWVYPNGHAKTIIIARSASTIKEDGMNQQNAEQAQQQRAQPGPIR